ncbi:MAG: hypothetical protein D6714_08370, partial [Bacteroidetes bacterium]
MGEKYCPSSHGGGGFAGVRFSLFRAFVSLKKVSLLTELEKVRGWLSTKVAPLRGFLFERNPRRRKPENRKPVTVAQNKPSHS